MPSRIFARAGTFYRTEVCTSVSSPARAVLDSGMDVHRQGVFMNNRTRTWLAVAALAAMLPIGAGAATVVTTGDHAAFRTSFDSVIDLIVQQRVAAQKLSPAQSMVAREQLQIQFMSLSKAAQQKLVEMARNAKSEEAAAKLAGALHTA